MAKEKKDTEKTAGMACMLHFADLGYVKAKITFSGSGDDGSIDSPEFLKEGEDDVEYKESEQRLESLKGPLLEAFNTQTHEIIEGIPEDWVNNDGGQGTLEIEIPSGKYTLDVGINYTQTNHSQYEGSLTDQ